tara:strand:- start:173 stop:1105 length:933 start_codon:yes stop_codon:yes gene_type:complete
MATTTSITSTYSGEFAGSYVSSALLSGNTLSQGLISIKPNVKFKEVLKRLDLDGITANASCDFSDTSTVTLTERILEPKELQVNLELCLTPFQSDWEAESMGFSALGQNLPKTFSDYFIGHISAKIAEKTEQDVWSGTAGAGSFDGFETLLTADAALPTANEVTGTTVDASNVVVELGKIADAIPDSLYGNEDLHIYVSQNIFRAYKRALGGFSAQSNEMGNNQDINVQYFDGIKVAMVNGMSSNIAIASLKSNLYFGTGLLSDQQELKVLSMADIDGSKNVRFIMRYTAGVQYSIVEDIVTYGIVNVAN